MGDTDQRQQAGTVDPAHRVALDADVGRRDPGRNGSHLPIVADSPGALGGAAADPPPEMRHHEPMAPQNTVHSLHPGRRRKPGRDSAGSAGSIGSSGSRLSIGSSGSILSIGSSGSILSIGSSGSILSIGSASSIGSIGSVLSAGSAFSVLSACSVLSLLSFRRVLSLGALAGLTAGHVAWRRRRRPVR